MYSKRWLYAVAALLVLAIILREGSFAVAAVLAALALGSAWLWNRFSLQGIQYERSFSNTRVFPGEQVDISISVVNRKLLPLPWLQLADEFPTRLPLSKGKLDVTSRPHVGLLSHMVAVRWYERVTWKHHVEAAARGYYPFGPVTLTSGDMFGLFTSEEQRPEQSFLIVYPRVVPLESLGLPSKQPFGDMRSPQRIFEDPSRTMGIRDYQRGDGLKRIHWKATARRQALQVRVYEPTATPQLAVFLNVSTAEQYWQGTDVAVLEGAISAAASIAQYALQQGYAVGVFANAPLLQSDQVIRVRPSSHPQQLAAILEALAKLNAFTIEPIEQTVEKEMPRLPWGATIVVVTGVMSPGLAAALERARKAGRQTVVVAFGEAAAAGAPAGMLSYSLSGEQLLAAGAA